VVVGIVERYSAAENTKSQPAIMAEKEKTVLSIDRDRRFISYHSSDVGSRVGSHAWFSHHQRR